MPKTRNKNSFNTGILVVVVAIVSVFTYFSEHVSYLLRTSILGAPEHAPFDGTVYPVEKTPDWVHLGSEKWDYSYSSLSPSDLMDIPYYDPRELETSTDNLQWGDPEDNLIRNAKITYSVPYMGTYLLDGKEYTGSHLAVDMKIPEGTPVFAIANGTVGKTSTQNSGFGSHIVLQHNNFPTLEDPNATEVLYSSYSHLGSVLVSEGDVVRKGDQIALSGSTGTSTTPHLHFQIDNSEAPWHPFWPFTWQEVEDADLNFWSAVNTGLGQEKALATTVHPMKYVQTYLDGEASLNPDTSTSADADSYIPPDPEVEDEVVEPEVVLEDPVLTFEFEVRPKYYMGQNADFSVLLRDQYGNKHEGFPGEVVVVSTQGLITAKPAIVNNFQFGSDGKISGTFSRMNEGRDRLQVEYNVETYYSDWFEIINPDKGVAFSDVSVDHRYYDAITYLAAEGVVAGYPDSTFKPDNAVSRVEALKFIFESIKEAVSDGNLPFSDVSSAEWYGTYLYTAYKNGVVDGYPDGTFKPANTVNKAEFYKILFNGMGVDVNPNVATPPFEDVAMDAWFAPFVAYAKEIGIIDLDVKRLNPSVGMTRGEVAYAMYKLMLLMK